MDKETKDFFKQDPNQGLLNGKYKLSSQQAQAILELKLQKLTNMEQEKIFSDYENEITAIKKYIKILTNPQELDKVMIQELRDVKENYGEPRRSLVSVDEGELRKEDLIKKEKVVVVLTKADYVKRLPSDDFKSQ